MMTRTTETVRAYTRRLPDPEFRTERGRKAAAASNGAKGTITRFMKALPDLTDEQIETVRRALPPTPGGGQHAA